MQRVVATHAKLLRAVRRRPGHLIAIDGSLGAGKTTVAKYLARRLGAQPVHLDKFVAKRRGTYVQHIKRALVRRRLRDARAAIVDGVCVLQILDSLSIEPDLLVYVKRMRNGMWADADELDLHEPVEKYITRWHEQVSKLAAFLGSATQASAGSVSDEVIRYHATWKPHRRAQLLYLRDDA